MNIGKHVPALWKRTRPRFQSDFLMRAHIPEWLGDLEGKCVLDACCGEGYVARMLAKEGAKVFGFDRDPEMILLAREQEAATPQGIDYRVTELARARTAYSGIFDVILLSGIPPSLSEDELYSSIALLEKMLAPDGTLLLTANHTDSYFKHAKSNWIVYTSEPDPTASTQQCSLEFYTPDRKLAFSGDCYFHTPEQLRRSLASAGLEVKDEYAPLASDDDVKHYPHMWIDERKIPFHLAIKAVKHF